MSRFADLRREFGSKFLLKDELDAAVSEVDVRAGGRGAVAVGFVPGWVGGAGEVGAGEGSAEDVAKV